MLGDYTHAKKGEIVICELCQAVAMVEGQRIYAGDTTLVCFHCVGTLLKARDLEAANREVRQRLFSNCGWPKPPEDSE